MKKQKRFIVITAITLVTLFTGMAFAQRYKCPLIEKIPGLNLTSEQKAKFEKPETEHRKKMIRLRADLSIAKVEKEKMMRNKTFKKVDIKKQIEKISAIKHDMQMAKLDTLTEFRSILNDDQWETFNQYRGSMEGGFGFKNGGGPGSNRHGRHRGAGFNKNLDGKGCSGYYGKRCQYDCKNVMTKE